MYKCIIIDDEPRAVAALEKYIDAMEELTLIDSFTDPLKALNAIREREPVDLILLDVDMPTINGIDLSKEIRHKTNKLIFTTAHSQYAYDAFEVQADAFLLKPFPMAKFAITVSRVLANAEPRKNTDDEDFFFVKSKEEGLRLVKLNYKDIIAIESKQNYVQFYTHTKNVITYMSLNEVMKILKDHSAFVQLHRSYIIRQDHIESIDGNQVKMINGIQLTVGDQFRRDFNIFITQKMIKAGKKNRPSLD